MEIGMRFAQELKDKYCKEGRTPFFPEFMSIDTRYFYDRLTKCLSVNYSNPKRYTWNVWTRSVEINPDGTWEMYETRQYKVICEVYKDGKLTQTERGTEKIDYTC